MAKFLKITLVALMACTLTSIGSHGLPPAVPRPPHRHESSAASGPTITVDRRFRNDFVSDTEFQNLLDELRRESEESTSERPIIEDPHNFINSEEELQEFLRVSALEHQLASGKTRDEDERVVDSNGAKDDNEQDETPECSICMEILAQSKNPLDPIDLNCGHSFHYYCLKDWFSSIRNRAKSCPNCRQDCNSEVLVQHVNKQAARSNKSAEAA